MPVDEVEAIVTVQPQFNEIVIAVPGPAGSGGGSSLLIVDAGWTPSYSLTYAAGDQRFTADGVLWVCVVSGSPGSWYKMSGFESWNSIVVPGLETIPADTLFPIAFIPGP